MPVIYGVSSQDRQGDQLFNPLFNGDVSKPSPHKKRGEELSRFPSLRTHAACRVSNDSSIAQVHCRCMRCYYCCVWIRTLSIDYCARGRI